MRKIIAPERKREPAKGGKQTPFCLAERKIIEKLLRCGFTCGEIAKEIGRSKNGVVTEVRNHGGKTFYDGDIAQAKAEHANEQRKKKLSEFNKEKSNKGPLFYMSEKLVNLEMQVEILHDCIKELMKGK